MDVLEHHHRRSLLGDPFEEDPAGREQVLLVADAALLQPEQVPEAGRDETALGLVGDVPLDRRGELRQTRTSDSSSSRIPARPRTISASAQNATPSP